MTISRRGDRPVVSIVTPSLNQGRFLERTIKSVVEQSYPDVEYIVVDGQSNDETVAILERYNHSIAWWVSEPDGGQAAAINKGFARAHGDILAWLGADDLYEPHAVARAAEYLQTHPNVDMVYGDIKILDEEGGVVGYKREAWFDRASGASVGFGIVIPQQSAFWRRELHERIGGLNEKYVYNLDGEYFARMVAAGAVVEHVPEVWAGFRMHRNCKTVLARGGPRRDRLLEEMAGEAAISYSLGVAGVRWLPFGPWSSLRRLYRLKRVAAKLLAGCYSWSDPAFDRLRGFLKSP